MKEIKRFIKQLFCKHSWLWSGNIVPQDSPTGMRLYRVEEVEEYKDRIANYEAAFKEFEERDKKNDEANDKAFTGLAEQLRHAQAGREGYKQAYERVEMELLEYRMKEDESTIAKKNGIHDLKERLKDSPIKARLKRFWKWIKSTVNQ